MRMDRVKFEIECGKLLLTRTRLKKYELIVEFIAFSDPRPIQMYITMEMPLLITLSWRLTRCKNS